MKYLFAILISFFIIGCAKNENLKPQNQEQTQKTKEEKPLLRAQKTRKTNTFKLYLHELLHNLAMLKLRGREDHPNSK